MERGKKMGFDSLLGNDRLKQNLSSAIARGRISHFYLISGPAGSGKKTLTGLLAAAALCSGNDKPCGVCPHCRKVFAGTHPDFITVDDPEKKSVPVELVRDARADIFIQPNEAEKKIYLFPRAQDMMPPSQNALLKILEEPPSYGVFILLTDNPEKLLPTIRSRCTELSLTALPEEMLISVLQKEYPQALPQQIQGVAVRSGGYLGQAKKILEESENANTLNFLSAYAHANAMGILQVLVPMEKWKRDAFCKELESWLQALTNAIATRSGEAPVQPMASEIGAYRSARDIMEGISALQTAIQYAQRNVSVGALCGWLCWALR